jgi:rsbT co-antagonist protein RsbR
MNPSASAVQALLAQHQDTLLDDWRQRLAAHAGAGAGEPDDLRRETLELVQALRAATQAADDAGAAAAMDAVLRTTTRVRAARGLAPEGSVLLVHAGKDALLALLRRHGPADAAQREAAAGWLQSLLDRCVRTLVAEFVAAREEVIRSQAQSLLDMSTPVITLWDSVLLLPLVGVVDSVRAVQVAERLLEAIGQTEAEVTLIDVTGVPVMDTSVARHLLRTVAAAEMLGTRVILTGISPTTAQTMVKLGIDLSGVPTRGSLKAGVALALAMTGRQVVDRNDRTGS